MRWINCSGDAATPTVGLKPYGYAEKAPAATPVAHHDAPMA